MLQFSRQCLLFIAAMACCLVAAGTANASIYVEDFDLAPDLGTPGWFAFSFGGAGNAGFITNSAPDGGADRAALIDVDSTGASTPTSWGGGLGTARTGLIFETSDFSLLSLTADIFGSETRAIELLIESRDMGNAVTGTLTFATTLGLANTYQNVGGFFSGAVQTGAFDTAAPTHVIIVRYADVASWGQDSGNVLRVDNVNLVPEPGVGSLVGICGVLGVLLRRWRRCGG